MSNSGSIGGGKYGLEITGYNGLYAAATLTASGTISGGTDAIRSFVPLDLTILPGAVFQGAVEGESSLILGGTSSAMLDISSFSSVSQIEFCPRRRLDSGGRHGPARHE